MSVKNSSNKKLQKRIVRNYELYLLLLPALVYIIIFHYGPMYGVQIAFKNFIASKGIIGSPWVGLSHFKRFINSYNFGLLIKNTLGISIYSLVAGFPAPIILALMLNQVNNKKYKKTIQTVTYAPNFISTVVMVGMITLFLAPDSGLLNQILKLLGMEQVYFMAKPEKFKTIYVLSGIWQGTGWGSIIYLAALSGINPELHEAAIIDGANRFQKIRYIDIPGITPTIVIMLILRLGGMMSVGFEKIFLMQNDLNLSSSEVISTYCYKVGLVNSQYSFSAAVGLFNSLINFILLLTVNRIAKHLTETSLW